MSVVPSRVPAGSPPIPRMFLSALLVFYAIKQLLFVVAFPPFTGHDEVAHYAYLRTVATEGRVPILLRDALPVDLAPYRRYALDWPDDGPGPQYLANHPPLYYVLMSPIYWVSDSLSPAGQQFVLRLAAIPFGMVTVFLAYRLVVALFPGDRFMATSVPMFVALQPQISYEAAMVNNDIVAIALYSGVLCLLVLSVRDRFRTSTCLWLGLVLGLALLTKGTALTAVPVIAAAIVMALGWRRRREWMVRAGLVAGPAIVLTAPWYLFLYRTYGNLSGFPQIAELQRSWNHPEGSFLSLLYSLDFVAMRFSETWGEFGWRRIPLDSTLLVAIGLPLAFGFVGLIVYAADRGPWHADPVAQPARWQSVVLVLLFFTCVVSYLAVVQFGTQFALTQARYFFPAVNAAAVLLMLGMRTWIPSAFHNYGAAALFCGLCALNVVILTQYVIPFYPRW